jgi:hypothetical protein
MELAKYGPPAGLLVSAPAIAGFGEFTDHEFELKEWGVRALLFLIINEHSEAPDTDASLRNRCHSQKRLGEIPRPIALRDGCSTGVGKHTLSAMSGVPA